jgi:hypothetical protein
VSWCVRVRVLVCALEAIDVVTSGTISISELCVLHSELQELVNIAQQVEDHLKCIHHTRAVVEDRLMCVHRTLSQGTRVVRLHPPCVLELHELHTGWAHIFSAAFLKRFSVHTATARGEIRTWTFTSDHRPCPSPRRDPRDWRPCGQASPTEASEASHREPAIEQ